MSLVHVQSRSIFFGAVYGINNIGTTAAQSRYPSLPGSPSLQLLFLLQLQKTLLEIELPLFFRPNLISLLQGALKPYWSIYRVRKIQKMNRNCSLATLNMFTIDR